MTSNKKTCQNADLNKKAYEQEYNVSDGYNIHHTAA